MSTTLNKISKSSEKNTVLQSSNKKNQSEPGLVSHPLFSQIISLQSNIGNRNVEKLLNSEAIQTKLRIGAPNDIYEQEADKIAAQVMKMSDSSEPVQRMCTECEDELKEKPVDIVRVKAEPGLADAVSGNMESQIRSGQRAGNELPDSALDFFEQRFRSSFSDVKIYNDSKSDTLNRSLHSRAFTLGNDIYFRQGEYNPSTYEGKKLLAHELTHVVQQNGKKNSIQRFYTEDCSTSDISLIRSSHNRAIAMLRKAIRRLNASPVTSNTQRHFANHFGGYGDTRRDIVVGHFERDLDLFTDSEMTYECESECDPGEPAYTYWIFGDIHICLPWLRSETLNERGESFIHELHHWDGLRGHLDLGYHRNNADNHTTWIVAVNNADAYSELAQDLYEQP